MRNGLQIGYSQEKNVAYAQNGVQAITDRVFARALLELHDSFTPRAREILDVRRRTAWRADVEGIPTFALQDAPAEPRRTAIPSWCRDQRRAFSVPADDAEQVDRAMQMGTATVVLDLDDSVVDRWSQSSVALTNVCAALQRRAVAGAPGDPHSRKTGLTCVRLRRLDVEQHGIVPGEPMPGALYDLAAIFFGIDHRRLAHPLYVVLAGVESGEEALWWRDLFATVTRMRGLPRQSIRCTVMLDSLRSLFELEDVAQRLCGHAVALAFERVGFTASLLRNFGHDPAWVLPDDCGFPSGLPLFRNAFARLVEVAGRRGLLALLAPATVRLPDGTRAATSGADQEPDQSALPLFFDPSEREPAPRPRAFARKLEPPLGPRTVRGSRLLADMILDYREGALLGRGRSHIGERTIDRSADDVHRLMLAQRTRHVDVVEIADDDGPRRHDEAFLFSLFERALQARLKALSITTPRSVYRRQREASLIGATTTAAAVHDES